MRLHILPVLAMVLFPAAAVAGGRVGDGAFDVLCRTLPDYQKPAGADYVPGADAQGRPVVPADLNALDASIPDVVNVPISVDVIRRFSLVVPEGLEMKPDVGVVGVHRDGRVTYNGQDITRQAYSVCAKDTEVSLPADAAVQPEVPATVEPQAGQEHGQAVEKSLRQSRGLPLVPKVAPPHKQIVETDMTTERKP